MSVSQKQPCPIERIVGIVKRLYAFERLRVVEVAQVYGVECFEDWVEL